MFLDSRRRRFASAVFSEFAAIHSTSGSFDAADSAFVDNADGAFYIDGVAAARRCAFRNTTIGACSGSGSSLTFSDCAFSGALPTASGFIDGGGNVEFQTTIGCALRSRSLLGRRAPNNPYARPRVLRVHFHFVIVVDAER